MDNICHTHHANHYEKTCRKFINSFLAMLLPRKLPKKDKKDEKEEDDDDDDEEEETKEEEVEPSSNMNLIWDETEMDNVDDDVMEEACFGNDYNIQSKGSPTSNNSPCTLKMDTKKTPAPSAYTSKDTSTDKYSAKTKTSMMDSTINKYTTSMDISQKILSDLKLDYDVVEDLKKMKANIMVFELCKITQLREKLHETLQNIQGS